jgi:Protein of unknown function VcgC/VcgE (DUF2780)
MSVRSLRETLLRPAMVLTIGAAVWSGGCGGSSSSAGNPAPQVSAGLPSALSAAAPLINSLMSAVPGLSQAQTILGAGGLLGLAKAKMPAGQYSQVAGALPGAEALVGEAVRQGAPSMPSGLSQVTDFLSKSGISANQVSQLASALGNAVQGKVPADVATAFATALK